MNDPERRCACGRVLSASEWAEHIQKSSRCRKADRAEQQQIVRELQAAQAFRDGLPAAMPLRRQEGMRPFNGLDANYRPPRKARASRA